MRGFPAAQRLFVGVGVGTYDHPDSFAPLGAAEEVAAVARVLEGMGYGVQPHANPDFNQAGALLEGLAAEVLPAGSCLVVLWAGHGEPLRVGGLHLVARNSRPSQVQRITSSQLVECAVACGASQILILLDTCYAEAASLEALELVRSLEEGLPSDGVQRWIGIVPSALAYETARDGVFGAQLLQLLREGPSDPELQLRWSAHQQGIRGDDLIDGLVKGWRSRDQSLVPVMRGNALPTMFPNPRFDPAARDQLVEQVLWAARGGNPQEEGDFFTGRVEPLAELVAWMADPTAGVALVTGPPGCGKSALLGRLAALADPEERQRILAAGPLEHGDPGEGAVAALVAARGATVAELVRRLEEELVRSHRLKARPEEPRNLLELLGSLDRLLAQGAPPVILIDGLEEAGGALEALVAELLRPLATRARLLISSRPIPPRAAGEAPLLERLEARSVVDLGALEASAQTQRDLEAYGRKRLEGVSAAMDPEVVVAEMLRLARRQEEGSFLLLRLITARLRQQPVPTTAPGWQAQLAGSVAEALEQELEGIPALLRGEEPLPQAARELLAALAWAYGQGFPVEEWALAATALSPTGTAYGREEVFWVLQQASRWVVESGAQGQAVYRLSHQRLVEHLRPAAWASPWKPLGEPAAVALAEAFGDSLFTGCEAGRRPEAQPYLWNHYWAHAVDGGAVGLARLRELSERNEAFLPDLARALNNLGNRLSELGRREEALAPTEEAVEIYRELSASNRAFLPDLARSLAVLGFLQLEEGDFQRACNTFREGLAVLRPAFTAIPQAFLPLAQALLQGYGGCLNALGQNPDPDLLAAYGSARTD